MLGIIIVVLSIAAAAYLIFDVLPSLRLRILGSNAGCRLSSV